MTPAPHVGCRLVKRPFRHGEGAPGDRWAGGVIGGGNRPRGLGAAEVRHLRDHVAACRVGDREGRTIGGVHPCTRHEALGPQKARLLEPFIQIVARVARMTLVPLCEA